MKKNNVSMELFFPNHKKSMQRNKKSKRSSVPTTGCHLDLQIQVVCFVVSNI